MYVYLQHKFGKSDELLEAMSKATAYLSGSQAVDFFVPGSSKPTSDWDFYVPYHVGTITSFMCKLEDMGVSWKTEKDMFGIKLDSEPDGFVISSYDILRIEVDGIKDEATRRGLGFELHGFGPNRAEWFHVAVADGVMVVKPHNEASIEYDEKMFSVVARGYLSRNNTETQVQILGEHRNSDFYTPSIFGHHSSCTQAVIGPYMAFHIYGDMACNHESYPWPAVLTQQHIHRSHNMQVLPKPEDKCVPVWMKYEERGYTYIDAPRQGVRTDLRRISDDGVIRVAYSRHTSAQALVINFYRSMLENMMWVQRSNRVVDISPSPTRFDWLDPDPSVVDWLDKLDRSQHRDRMRKYARILL